MAHDGKFLIKVTKENGRVHFLRRGGFIITKDDVLSEKDYYTNKRLTLRSCELHQKNSDYYSNKSGLLRSKYELYEVTA